MEEITTEENTPRKVGKRKDMASPGSNSTSPVHKAYIVENEEGNSVAHLSSESNAGTSSEQHQRSETEQDHIQQTQSHTNMSSNPGNSGTINNPDVMRLLNTMRDEQKKALQDINDEQKATKDMFGRELKKLKKELKDEIMSKVTGMQQKLKDFEKTVHAQDAMIKQLSEGNTTQTAVPFYPDVTIIARNVRYHEGENITQKINDIIHTHLKLPHEEVIRCERTASRNNKPGAVKIQMSSLVLRNKRKLNKITGYTNVYMRSALSHTERVMERNFQTILREIPNGGEFRRTGHGIVIRKGLNTAQGD